jgi:hypothetical protein
MAAAHIGGVPVEELIAWMVPLSLTFGVVIARERLSWISRRFRQQMKKCRECVRWIDTRPAGEETVRASVRLTARDKLRERQMNDDARNRVHG